MCLRTIAPALVVALLIVAPAAHAADLQFGAVQPLSPAGANADAPTVDVDPNGNAVGAWRESVNGKLIVHASYRSAGGFFVTSKAMSPTGVDSFSPDVAIARDGTAIVAWTQPQTTAPAGRFDVVASVRPPGGDFGAPAILSPGSDSAGGPKVEFDDSGNAIVMFTTDLGNGDVGKERAELVTRPAGGSFSAPTSVFTTTGDPALNQDGFITGYSIAFDHAGNALIAFAESCCAFNQDHGINQIQAFGRKADGTLEQPVKRVAGRNTDRAVSVPQVSISGSRQLVVYNRQVGAGTSTAEYVTRVKNGDEWSGYQIIAGDRDDPLKAGGVGTIGTDAAGNVVAGVNDGGGPREGLLAPDSRNFGVFRPLPAGILGTDVQLKDDGSGQRSWTTTDPAGTHLWLAGRSAGAAPTFGTPQDVATYDNGVAVDVGPNGQTAVLWLKQEGLDEILHARFGAEPPPPPAPGEPTPTPVPEPPPPPPPPPVTNAIDAVGKVESGRPVVLSVALSGVVTRIEWRIGNSGPYVGDAVERAIRLRVTGTATITAKLIGPGGTKEVSRTITGPKAPTDANAKRVASGKPNSASAVIATGRPGTLSGTDAGCAQTTVYAGGRTLFGCMQPIDELTDIPAAERGVLDPLASAYGLTRSDASLMNRAVQLTDGYLASRTVTLDGLWPVVPGGSAQLVAYPQAQALTSSNAAIRVAGQLLKPSGSGFNLKLPTTSGAIDLGSVPRPSGLRALGGFPYTGPFDVTLGGGYATIETNLKFPDFVSRNGVVVQPRVRIYAFPDAISGDTVPTLGPMGVDFGPIPVRNLTLHYNPGSDQWEGGGTACVFQTNCLSFEAPAGALRFAGGGLSYARTSLSFGHPGQLLAPGIFLESATMGFGLNPTRVFGGARISMGSFVTIDGREVFAFPSDAAPYTLAHEEVGDAFPAALYAKRYTRPLIAAGADVLIDLPVIGEQRLGGGYMLYEMPGYVAMGGSAGFNVLGIVRYSGAISGEYDLIKQRYNLHGDISACLIAVDDDLCAGAVAHMSRGPGLEGGTGACLKVGPVSVGGGILWAKPHDPYIWPIDGCKWSPFKIDIQARAAQAAGSFTMKVVKGQSPVLRLNGGAASPRVKVTGPNGQTLSSGDQGLTYTQDGKVRIVDVNTLDAHYTLVGLQNAAAGTWKVELLPDSVPVTGIARATDPPDAKVSGSVRGSGSDRVLKYDVLQRPAQRVTFYDVSPGGARKAIGTVAGGKGTLRFTPAPGGARHTVIAAFELNDIPAEEKTVTRFSPPPATLGTPRSLKVRRSGTKLLVSWSAVRGASSYELTATTSAGDQIFKTVRPRKATLTGVAKTVSGTVTVRAVATLRQSKLAKRTFAKTKQATRKLKSLPKCTVKAKKVRCR